MKKGKNEARYTNMFMQNLLSVWPVKDGLYSAYTSKPIGFTALEDVAEAAAVILMEGPEKHGGKDYWFSADVLAPPRVAETLTAATGQKFTAEVLDAKSFLSVVAQPGSAFEPAYAKGGLELFSQVEDGRMAYVRHCRNAVAFSRILGCDCARRNRRSVIKPLNHPTQV